MVTTRRLLKLMFTVVVLNVIQEKTTNVYTAARCSPSCVLFTNYTDIIALDSKTSKPHSVVSGLTKAVAIDVHFSLEYVFWSDVSEKNIKRSGIDGSEVTTIITNIGVCEGLAVEWRASQLYWTDTTHHSISVSDLGGNNQRILLSLGNDGPRDIALDPDSGIMVWTGWGTKPKIEKASLSGNQRVAIVTVNIQRPNGIELDRGNRRIFWVDEGVDRVESVDYHGSNRRLVSRRNVLNPFGVAFIPPFLFYTDWMVKRTTWRGINAWRSFSLIGHLRKIDATTGTQVVSGYNVRGIPKGIVAYDSSRQPPVASPCAVNNGGCSHFCVVKISGYECVCPAGLALRQDGRRCEEKMEKFLLFNDAVAKSTYIISLDVNYLSAQPLLHLLGNQRPIAMDFDPVEARVYVADVAQGFIASVFFNASSWKILFYCNVKTPDGIAIDKVGRNIYWTDSGTNRIEVARLDGSRRKLLISSGLDEPRAIALDERNGLMYWTDWGSKPRIEQAAMDGSSRRSIITGNLAWPNGLTIDQNTNLLYWADAKLDTIEVTDLNGKNRRTIFSSAVDIHPFGLTLYQDMLYWTDWKTKSISQLNLTSKNQEMIVTGLTQPMAIHFYDATFRYSGLHPCSANNGLCSDLCLLRPQGGYMCACPTGMTLKSDGKSCDYDTFNILSSDKFMLFAGAGSGKIYKIPLAVLDTPCFALGIKTNISWPAAVDYDPVEDKVYWTDLVLKQVARAYPNGSHLEVIARHNVRSPEGIAVDWTRRRLYWTESKAHKIEVSHLDGSFRTSFFTKNIDLPRAVILDIRARKMYWSDWGASPRIEQVNMDGTARKVLVSSGLIWVNSLALDLKNKLLYWCDAKRARVERVDLQGNNRVLVLDLSSGKVHPFGLALYEDVLFWTDWKTKNVHKYNMTSFVSEVLVHGIGRPMEIEIYDYETIATVVTCPALPEPPNGVRRGCTETTTELFKKVCQFACSPGFNGVGSTSRKCLENGRWSGQELVCQVISCPPLVTPPRAILLTPSCSSTYGSSCSFTCHSEYIQSVGNVTRTCLASGQWSGNNINCTDSQPPTFGATCSRRTLLVYADRDKFSTLVNWAEPVAFDNSGIAPTVTSNYPSPQRLSQGSHVIKYTAVDKSGNVATCFFKIKVSVISCTSLMVAPGSPLRMSNCGNHYGSKCSFSCAVGYRLNGSTTVSCVAPRKRPPGIWDNPVPKCQAVRCPSLQHPLNGLKTGCSDPLSEGYGTFCSFSCNVGYNLNGSSVRQCQENETWSGLTAFCQEIICGALFPPHNVAVSPSSCLSSSTHGQTCRFYCLKAGYVLQGNPTRVCGNEGKWTSTNAVYCKDNTPPSFNNACPRNNVVYVPKCSSNALVSWNEPAATDNSGHVTISYPAVRPPANLSIGLYSIHYSATDDLGNRANCSFIVQVARKSCSVLQPPSHGSISFLSCGSLFGSQASLSCNKGYRLVGSSVRSCKEDGEWSGNITTCNAVKCPAITTPSHGLVFPEQCKIPFPVNYKTECFFACNVTKGYRLEGPSNVSCLETGSWSADIRRVICKDIQPPSIQCPPNKEVPTKPGQSYATVTWHVPDPTDNSNEPINLRGLRPPQRMNVGRTKIVYNVSDSAGLIKSCVFSIDVKDLEPPRIDKCPSAVKIISPVQWHKLVLPAVKVTDNVGLHLFETNIQNGSEVTWGEHNITYKASDKAGNTAFCRFLITIADSPCKELPAPKNGAKACETWLAGIMCTVHCNKGYGFAINPDPLYYCRPNGKWWNAKSKKGTKNPALPDCSETHKPKEAIFNGEFHYLTDKCGGKAVNEEIAKNFIELIMSTSFGRAGGCYGNQDCKIENVKVDCGEQTRLRRETVDGKKPATVPLIVSFAFKVPMLSYSNTSLDLNQTYVQISDDILTALDVAEMTLNISGVVMVKDPSRPPEIRPARFICDEGQVQSGTTCVNCPVGYFFNGTSCEACAVDHYQDQEAQTSCVMCPSGTRTFGQQASKQLQDCKECADDPEYAAQCDKMAWIESWCRDHELVTKEKCTKSCGWC